MHLIKQITMRFKYLFLYFVYEQITFHLPFRRLLLKLSPYHRLIFDLQQLEIDPCFAGIQHIPQSIDFSYELLTSAVTFEVRVVIFDDFGIECDFGLPAQLVEHIPSYFSRD